MWKTLDASWRTNSRYKLQVWTLQQIDVQAALWGHIIIRHPLTSHPAILLTLRGLNGS